MVGKRRTIAVGMAQIHVEGGCPDVNMERATQAIEEARRTQCDVVVLPEALDLGWTDNSATDLADTIPGRRSGILGDAARKAGVCVVAGLTEAAESSVYNTSVFIDASGTLVAKHRKINILTIAKHLYSIGSSLSVVDTVLGRVGIPICADNLPTSLSLGTALARMGARIILSASAWAVRSDHDNEMEPYGAGWITSYSALSRRFAIPVVGVSNIGTLRSGAWKGRRAIGRSLALNADGTIVAHLPYGVEAFERVNLDVYEQAPEGTAITEWLERRGFPAY